MDPDHVVPRSAGGGDELSNLLHVCRPCHRLRAAPYAEGRLLASRIIKDGVRGIAWQVVKSFPIRGETGKLAYLDGRYEILRHGFVVA
jgi:hypothetical protein